MMTSAAAARHGAPSQPPQPHARLHDALTIDAHRSSARLRRPATRLHLADDDDDDEDAAVQRPNRRRGVVVAVLSRRSIAHATTVDIAYYRETSPLSSRVARNFRQGVRQSVAFLSVHSPRSAALPSRPYNQKTSWHVMPPGWLNEQW